MLKKIFIFLIIALINVSLLLSCGFLPMGTGGDEEGKENGNEENKENEEAEEPDNLIYNASSELYLIVDPMIDGAYTSDFVSGLTSLRSEVVNFAAPNSQKHAHEIVIGNLDRDICKTAIDRMNRIDKNDEDEFLFAVYSDGSSIALVYEDDPTGAVMAAAISYLTENYLKTELVKSSGADVQVINILDDYFRKKDAESSNATWAKFEERYGKELADSFRALYSIYSPECIKWLANLYDPDICVCKDLYGEEECSGTKYCKTGGFYYSNSGRDTLGYLPDVESTHQALNFLTSAGLGGNYTQIITEDMKRQIGDFVYALEEPNGYFYHPQWGIEFTDARLTRRGRDLSWSCGILSTLGRTPKYTTASGMKGEDVLGTASSLTGRLGSSASAVSKVIAAAGAPDPILKDLDSFKQYLAGKDIENNSYGVGSEIGTLVSQIKERDRALAAEGKPTIAPYLIEWLNEHQNPETGHWDFKKPGDEGYRNYHGTNGLLKISGIYIELGVQMPYAMEAAKSAMADIINPAEIIQVVDLYNTWFSIKNITNNLETCGGASGAALADEIRAELRKSAPEGILVSRDKISAFLKTDGSASYLKDQSSPNNQGCPSAVPGTNEGDVNGSTIAINGIIGNIAAALGVSKPALFGSAERYIFLKEIDNLSPISKVDASMTPEPLTFDYEDVGIPSEELTVLDGNGGSANVIADPTGRSDGNVVRITSVKNAGDTIKIPIQNASGLAKSFVFEGDFYISEASTDYLLQLSLDACYMVTFRPVTDESDPDYGRIRIVETSSGTGNVSVDRYLGVTVDKDRWFKIKMEYYYGDDSTVRIKFYADLDLTDDKAESLYAISDNYRDEAGKKVSTGYSTPSKSSYISQIYVMKSATVDMYVDNLNCYVSRESYSSLLGKDDSPYFNVDTEGSPEKIYDFDGTEIDSDVFFDSDDENITLTDDGRLSLIGSANASEIGFPVTVREAMAKCAVAEFDLSFTDAVAGKETLLLRGMDGKESIFGFILKCEEGEDGNYLTVSPRGDTTDAPIKGAMVADGETVRIRLEYYHREDVILVYLNGEFVGASTKLYAEGSRRIMDSFSVTAIKDSGVCALIDNVKAEMTAGIFEDAVAPEKPEKVFDFESDDPQLTINGKGTAVASHGKDKALIMNNSTFKGSLTVPVNVRSAVVNSLILSVKLDYTSLSSEGDTHRLVFKDSEGNISLEFLLEYVDDAINLYEVGKGGKLTTPLYSFKAEETVELDFEIFGEKRIVHLMKNGAAVAKSSVFVGDEYLEGGFASLTIESLGAKSTVAIDDLKCEALYTVYKTRKVNGGANAETDLSAGITFDSSSSGNLPSLLHTLNYADNCFSVENLYNEVAGEYSNVLVLNKTGAGNDELGFTSGASSNSGTMVFEADLKLDVTTNGIAYRIYFGSDKKGANAMYMIQFNKTSSGNVYIEDVSTAGDNPTRNSYLIAPKGGEWFNLQVEMCEGDRDSVEFRIYVDGVLVALSNNFAGSHDPNAQVKPLPTAVSFYLMGATRGEMYFDNVKLYSKE